MKKATKGWPWLLALAAVVLVAAVLVMALRDDGGETDVTQAGVAYLEALEKKDPDAVTRVLRQRRLAELAAQREELLRQVKDGERDPFTMFQDAVIMGDSRAEGFWYFGFVDQARTLTGAGHTILDIKNQMAILEEMNPTYIYLCYGLNDIKIGYWGNVDRFVTRYMEYVAGIRERMPEAVVVISSTLPYREKEDDASADPTEETKSEEDIERERMKNIPAWNDALAKACEENNVIFVDNSAICAEYEHLWEMDGIHVKKSFYSHWARNLVIAALEEGGTQVEENDS